MSMTILKILDYPNPRLKNRAARVDDISNHSVQSMIQDMLDTLKNTEQCGGLAATQLDIKDPLQIFVYYDVEDDNPDDAQACVAVNPEIVSTEGEVVEPEGCMSVYPDYIQASVKRPEKTTMRAMDENGETFESTRDGYLAKLFIHEVDHLQGRLYIDHLKPVKRNMLDKKIQKLRKKLKKQAT